MQANRSSCVLGVHWVDADDGSRHSLGDLSDWMRSNFGRVFTLFLRVCEARRCSGTSENEALRRWFGCRVFGMRLGTQRLPQRMQSVTLLGYARTMAPVPSLLLTQVIALSLCVVGGLSAIDWTGIGVLLRADGGAEAMRWMFVGVKLVGIVFGIACWWRWRVMLREVTQTPERCSACLHPTHQGRCAECGRTKAAEPQADLLPALRRLQKGDFASGWILYAFFVLARNIVYGVRAGISVMSGNGVGFALQRWRGVATGTSDWIWFEAPFVFVSFVLIVRGLMLLRKYRDAEVAR